MILNVFSDDLKFVDLGVDLFDKTSYEHKFVIITENNELDISDLNNNKSINIIVINSNTYFELIKGVNNYSGIILNSLIREPLKIFLYDCLHKNKRKLPKIAWSFFGSELYIDIDLITNYLGKSSKKVYYKQKKIRRLLFLKKIFRTKYDTLKLLSQIDYIMSFIQSDIDYFNKKTNLKLESLWLTYYPLENLIGSDLFNKKAYKNGNILVGNSSSITNNHIEAFKIIKKKNIKNKKIIVPLSYGDKEYSKTIVKIGYEFFGSNFIPLTEFMPRHKYNEIILSCSIVFMNHYRQQAMGNILTALWLGCRVYLNDFISSYKYFEDIGISIESIQDISISNLNFTRSSEKDISSNRAILLSELGIETSIKRLNSSLKELSES